MLLRSYFFLMALVCIPALSADFLIAQSTHHSRRNALSMTDDDLRQPLRNVRGLGQAGTPGPFCVFDENATALIVGGSGAERAALVAAANFRQGRVVAFGHGDYLNPGMLSGSSDGLDVTKADFGSFENKLFSGFVLICLGRHGNS